MNLFYKINHERGQEKFFPCATETNWNVNDEARKQGGERLRKRDALRKRQLKTDTARLS